MTQVFQDHRVCQVWTVDLAVMDNLDFLDPKDPLAPFK